MKNTILCSWVYFPAVYIRGDLWSWCTTYISSRQERPESECVCSLCMCRALMEGASSQTSAHCYKAPEGSSFWLCHALGLSCLSPLWLGLIWGFLGQSSQLRALCSGFGGDAAYFPCVLWDNLPHKSPHSCLWQLFSATQKGSFLSTEKWQSHGSQLSWSFFCLGSLHSDLTLGFWQATHRCSQLYLFKTSVAENWKKVLHWDKQLGLFYHEGKPLITTHSKCSQKRNKCSESGFLHLSLWDEAIPDFNSQTYIGLLNIYLSKTYPLFPYNWISIFPSVLQLFPHVMKAITDSLANVWHTCVSFQNDNFHFLTLEHSHVYSPFVCLLITSLCLATAVSSEFDRFFHQFVGLGIIVLDGFMSKPVFDSNVLKQQIPQ